MAQPYVGEIRMFGGNFAPAGWAFCDGSLLAISENETLFQLIGTTYGGDGQNTFALPDLRGRIPVHFGAGYTLAETFGVETVTLTVGQIPNHSHPFPVSAHYGNTNSPVGALPGAMDTPAYAQGSSVALKSPLLAAGGSQPHSNLMPTLCVSFIISLYGIFPSPT